MNCLSEFNHFAGLVLEALRINKNVKMFLIRSSEKRLITHFLVCAKIEAGAPFVH